MKVLDRVETLEHIKLRMYTERIVISRYSDGEYLMMEGLNNNTHDSFDVLPAALKKAIKHKKQFVCINYLKPHNIERKDRWCAVQNYLSMVGEHSLYGCCNWNIYDFQNNNDVLPFLFSKRTLLVTGHVEESKQAFKNQKSLQIYQMLKENASSSYEEDKKLLIKHCSSNSFDNIVFACGPIGKVLLTDLIGVCNSNLIDIGSLLNAIINEYSNKDRLLINQWTMSWAKSCNIKVQSKAFFDKLSVL
jgi:hypothetical protein